jgi:hypothetical protein
LKEVAEDLGRDFTALRAVVVARNNFGASGELKQHIEAGAPVDVFMSAAEDHGDALRPKFVFAENVRQTLEYVTRGEAFIALLLCPEGQSALARRGFLPSGKDPR